MKKLFVALAMSLVLASQAQIPNYVPSNGLAGYWPFTGNANDLSGSGYHGTVYGAQLATDRFNNAACSYSFNGINNYILTPFQGILGSNSRAVSFWAKTNVMATSEIGVAWGTNASGSRFNCGLNYGSTGATIGLANGAITYSTPSPVYDNQWHHYVFQFSGTSLNQVQIYQDAVLLSQQVHAFNPSILLNTVAGFNVQFGRVDYSPSPDYFKGQLDDIGIWTRTLSQCEIMSLYHGDNANISADGPTTFCSGGSVMLSSNLQGSYSWNVGANTQSIVATSSGNYNVSVTIGSCTINSNTVNVIVNPLPALMVSSSAGLLCAGETATLNVSGANTYLWSNGASGSVSVISPTISTSYTVTGTSNNCSSSFIYTQNVTECTGIKEISSDYTTLEIFPNPANETISVRSNGELVSFTIYDSQGRHIKNSLVKNCPLDISDLQNGLYLIRTFDGKTSKFVKR